TTAPTTTAPTTTAPTTTAPTTTAPTTTAGTRYGSGGLVADLESWADRELPLFITASHIDISDIESISRFRSNAGHDYTDSFETCCSMKHYFRPKDYYGVRFTQSIYSPVDGVVLYLDEAGTTRSNDWKVDFERETGESPPDDYRDMKMYIRPDDAPNLWIRLHHLSPVEEVLKVVPVGSGEELMLGIARTADPGFRVSAGDLVGHGLGEISVERHLDGNGVPSPCAAGALRAKWGTMPGCVAKRQFHSIFEFMTEEVFEQYRAVADVTRDDFVISVEDRAADPLACEGEDFVIRDVDAYVTLQGNSDTASSTPEPDTATPEASLPSADSLAAGRAVLAAHEGSSSSVLAPFEAVSDFALVVASDAGPIQLSVDDGNGARSIYDRPEGSGRGITTYETAPLGAGSITVLVEADDSVAWRILAVVLP
ncbi:MAG: hypothetical protein CMJ68_24230, partial [Planctomycetaceae bacterium]|nr:hypothetical protein [Planctomycetaceae bacterium]